jgi:hypothetical protein
MEWNKEEFNDQWNESIIVPIYKMGDKTIVIIVGHHCHQIHTKCHRISSSQG